MADLEIRCQIDAWTNGWGSANTRFSARDTTADGLVDTLYDLDDDSSTSDGDAFETLIQTETLGAEETARIEADYRAGRVYESVPNRPKTFMQPGSASDHRLREDLDTSSSRLSISHPSEFPGARVGRASFFGLRVGVWQSEGNSLLRITDLGGEGDPDAGNLDAEVEAVTFVDVKSRGGWDYRFAKFKDSFGSGGFGNWSSDEEFAPGTFRVEDLDPDPDDKDWKVVAQVTGQGSGGRTTIVFPSPFPTKPLSELLIDRTLVASFNFQIESSGLTLGDGHQLEIARLSNEQTIPTTVRLQLRGESLRLWIEGEDVGEVDTGFNVSSDTYHFIALRMSSYDEATSGDGHLSVEVNDSTVYSSESAATIPHATPISSFSIWCQARAGDVFSAACKYDNALVRAGTDVKWGMRGYRASAFLWEGGTMARVHEEHAFYQTQIRGPYRARSLDSFWCGRTATQLLSRSVEQDGLPGRGSVVLEHLRIRDVGLESQGKGAHPLSFRSWHRGDIRILDNWISQGNHDDLNANITKTTGAVVLSSGRLQFYCNPFKKNICQERIYTKRMVIDGCWFVCGVRNPGDKEAIQIDGGLEEFELRDSFIAYIKRDQDDELDDGFAMTIVTFDPKADDNCDSKEDKHGECPNDPGEGDLSNPFYGQTVMRVARFDISAQVIGRVRWVDGTGEHNYIDPDLNGQGYRDFIADPYFASGFVRGGFNDNELTQVIFFDSQSGDDGGDDDARSGSSTLSFGVSGFYRTTIPGGDSHAYSRSGVAPLRVQATSGGPTSITMPGNNANLGFVPSGSYRLDSPIAGAASVSHNSGTAALGLSASGSFGIKMPGTATLGLSASGSFEAEDVDPVDPLDQPNRMVDLLPQGPGWERGNRNQVRFRVLQAMSVFLRRVEDRARQMIRESDPRNASELFTEWATEMQVPRCTAQFGTISTQDIRNVFVTLIQFAGKGGTNEATFIEMMAGFGFTVQVSYPRKKIAKSDGLDFTCVDPLYTDEWNFVFQVEMPAEPPQGAEWIRCLVNMIKPAHTVAIYDFGVDGCFWDDPSTWSDSGNWNDCT